MPYLGASRIYPAPTDPTWKTRERIAPVTPGDVLREEFKVPLGVSARGLARDNGVPCAAPITCATSMRRAAGFFNPRELQDHYRPLFADLNSAPPPPPYGPDRLLLCRVAKVTHRRH